MTTKVVKGTLWTLVGLLVPIFFSLFATPIVTRLLGAESYGLYVLILLIPTYFSFADLGMNIASTKFGSEAFAQHSPKREARIVRTSAAIALVGSLPLSAAMIAFAGPILSLFKIPEHLAAEAAFALRLAAVVFVVNFLNNIFNTPELTRLRMDLNTAISSGIRLIGVVMTPIVVYLGGGVVGAVAVALCVSVVTLLGHLIVSTRLLPELFGLSIDRAAIRPMLKFGGSLLLAFIATAFLVNLEKLVLARVASVETLAYYSIAATVAAMLTFFSGSMAQSLMPAFSQMQSRRESAALQALYSRGLRITLIWLLPAIVTMVLVGRPFFTYWFSPDFGRESTGPYYIIVAGLFFTVLAYFPYTIVISSGRSDILAKIYWAELVPYLLLLWWLTARLGAVGAAIAWSLRALADSTLLFLLAPRISGVRFVKERIPQFLAAAAIMLLPVGALLYFQELNLQVIGTALAAAAAYVFIVLTRVLGSDEVLWLKSRIGVYLSK